MSTHGGLLGGGDGLLGGGDGGDGDGDGGGSGNGDGGESGGGTGIGTVRCETTRGATASTVTPTASEKAEGLLASVCKAATAYPT